VVVASGAKAIDVEEARVIGNEYLAFCDYGSSAAGAETKEGKELDLLSDPNLSQVTYAKIYFVKETKETVEVEIGSTGYASLYYSDRNLAVPSGVTAKTYYVKDGVLTVDKEYATGAIIPANTAVVLNGAQGKYTFTVTIDEGQASSESMLYGFDEANQTTVGPDANTEYKFFKLARQNKNRKLVGFWYDKTDGSAFVMPYAHRAYMAVPADLVEGASAKGWSFDDAVTAITDLETEPTQAAKAYYDLNGRYVGSDASKLQRGVYVSGDKKFVVK